MRALKGLLLGDAQSIVLAAPHDVQSVPKALLTSGQYFLYYSALFLDVC